MLHRIHNEGTMTAERRHEAMVDVLLMMQIKFMTSRLYRLFRYPADRKVAEAVYMQLNNKFAIKQYGSWLAVLRMRSEEIISASGIHKNAIAKMDDDIQIVRMISDIQGRIRDMLKNIYDLHLRVNKSGEKIGSQSSVIEYDGMEALKDRQNGLTQFTRYLKSVIADKNSFIKEELEHVVCDIVQSCPPKHLNAALTYVSHNHLKSSTDPIDPWVDELMIHSFHYLAENRVSARANVDLISLLARLRGVYTSSRSTDPDLLKLRHDTESIVKRAIDSRTEAVIASTRTALLLYMVARAYTMKHYS